MYMYLKWLFHQNSTMLCRFCSHIDLDQLCSVEGYEHHASCEKNCSCPLRNRCDSCKLIWDSQWSVCGGSLVEKWYDLGPLETQIIARVVIISRETTTKYVIVEKYGKADIILL